MILAVSKFLKTFLVFNILFAMLKGEQKKTCPSKNGFGSGGITVCPENLSFSQFVVLMRTTICEKDSLPGQTVLPPEPKPFLERQVFFCSPFTSC